MVRQLDEWAVRARDRAAVAEMARNIEKARDRPGPSASRLPALCRPPPTSADLRRPPPTSALQARDLLEANAVKIQQRARGRLVRHATRR